MEKGRIIFLNGVTSAGKTSIVEALQERDDIFFMWLPTICFRKWWEKNFCRKIIGNTLAK